MARTTLLTHTLTHTGKGAGGINGHDSAAYHCLMEQIGPEKTKKQTMNGSQSVGKDEVGSSNLPSSSTITALFVKKRAVLLYLRNSIAMVKYWTTSGSEAQLSNMAWASSTAALRRMSRWVSMVWVPWWIGIRSVLSVCGQS